MKYSNFINIVNDSIRDKSAWISKDISQRQLRLSYVASLAILSELPLRKMSFIDKYISRNKISDYFFSYNLPDNLFNERLDQGIDCFLFDQIPSKQFKSVSYDILRSMNKNKFQQCNTVYSFDKQGNKVFVTEPPNEFKCRYAPKPDFPSDKEEQYPLDDMKDIQRAVHIVSYHVSGLSIRDNAGAQFNALLSKLYKQDNIKEEVRDRE